MCGIAGVYNFRTGAPIPGGLAGRMAAALRHRGPDDQGEYAEGPLALAMQRLSILDLSPTGHQPMANENNTVFVVFNGEIYNHALLRRELEAKGHSYRSHSDTESLLHLYEEEGPAMVERLDGMFAFALWDAPRRRLLLAVDRVGIKPLCYALTPDGLAFGSELKALLQHPSVERTLDAVALDQYLRFLYIPAPRTVLQGVKKLLPGSFLLVGEERVEERVYWRPAVHPDQALNAEAWKDAVRSTLSASVAQQLESHVPLGAFLSGGTDSSAVVAFMAQAMDRPVETFTIGFARGGRDLSYDEVAYARRVATRYGTVHSEFVVTPDLAEVLPRIVWHFDEPFANVTAVPFFYLCQLARRHVTVALAGVGGDELFSGYPRYLALRYLLLYSRIPSPVRRAIGALSGLLPPGSSEYSLTARARKFLQGGEGGVEETYLHWVSFSTREERERLYQPSWLARLAGDSMPEEADQRWSEEIRDPVDRAQAFDLQTYLPFNLLTYSDRMSMAHSLEVRVPFCGNEMLDLAGRIPGAVKVRGGLKGLLRDALRSDLPSQVLDRRKQGFSVPLASWLREELRPTVEGLLAPERVGERGWFRPEEVTRLVQEHMSGSANHANRLWALLVLDVWAELYLDRRETAVPDYPISHLVHR
ncbi:MAG: asparagine synthase (glutamine-hydrolyzing) [Chloroflexi bacterium]|nr:asparagine synthase (glutamine-hydrolyzing) [Chloroflexota bacterium]